MYIIKAEHALYEKFCLHPDCEQKEKAEACFKPTLRHPDQINDKCSSQDTAYVVGRTFSCCRVTEHYGQYICMST
jgi:hypothetical protein